MRKLSVDEWIVKLEGVYENVRSCVMVYKGLSDEFELINCAFVFTYEKISGVGFLFFVDDSLKLRKLVFIPSVLFWFRFFIILTVSQ